MGIRKKHRLKSRTQIQRMMEEGVRFKAYPIHMVTRWTDEMETLPQFAFSVPKRIHRSAVDRNSIKRQMREQVREHIPGLQALCNSKQLGLTVILIYLGKDKLTGTEHRERISLLLNRLNEVPETLTTDGKD